MNGVLEALAIGIVGLDKLILVNSATETDEVWNMILFFLQSFGNYLKGLLPVPFLVPSRK
jgi:hypothetical protein